MLTTLSPCVLPILPLVTATALRKSKFGPVFLAAGLIVTFVLVSLLIGAAGALFGLDTETVKILAGVALFASGLLFFFPALADRFSSSMSRLTNQASTLHPSLDGYPGVTEFLNGALLGLIWTPCSGPSLGAALGLAARADSRLAAAQQLAMFALGTAIPLMAIAYGAKHFVGRLRQQSGSIDVVKKLFGVLLVVFGLLIITGYDRSIEALLNDLLPDAWIRFVTHL